MKKVELVNGISSSVLGFGCAPILGSVSAKKALRALDCAFDCGINHFDLARSYGYGEAENFVGKVIKGKRDKVVLASKFGIIANWKAKVLRPTKPILRYAFEKLQVNVSQKPISTVNPGASIGNKFHNRILIEGRTMRKSLENSLRALGTDYLDYYFLHEPLQSITHMDELASIAEMLKAEGKIRAWGLAFMRSQELLHHNYFEKFDILQFNNSPGEDGYDTTVADRGQIANIIFSPLSSHNTTLKPTEKLNKLFDDFPRSVILCSMFNELHIKENAALLDTW
jgi:aryl-alcohol dehydrogenase-like predicted oxidoreductase